MRSRALTAAGLVVFAAATAALLLAGRTQLRVSADAEAPAVPLAAVFVPFAVGILLTRLVPPRLPSLPVAVAGRPTLARQAWALVAISLLFSALVLVMGTALWYPLVKVALMLGGGWLVLRIWRGRSPGAGEQRAGMSTLAHWLAPVPAIAAWAYLSYYSPLVGDQDLSGYREYDRGYLAVAMLVTFLTASVTEELFYRVLLQTRLEALLGRWAGIVTAALLFAVMHVHRVGDGPLWEVLATITIFNGGFGLFVGYLWSRYRNVWAIIAVHGAVNSLTLLPLFV